MPAMHHQFSHRPHIQGRVSKSSCRRRFDQGLNRNGHVTKLSSGVFELRCGEHEDNTLAKELIEFICAMQQHNRDNSCLERVVQGFDERPNGSFVERLNDGIFKLDSWNPIDESVALECIRFFKQSEVDTMLAS